MCIDTTSMVLDEGGTSSYYIDVDFSVRDDMLDLQFMVTRYLFKVCYLGMGARSSW